MVVDQKSTTLLNSMNVLKYAAYGGYTNYPVIYDVDSQEAESLTYMTSSRNFVSVGLLKFFSCNVNFSLVTALLALIVFSVALIKKYRKRNQYLETKEQYLKDEYTKLRRSCQWVYDHFVFPLLIIFSMIIVFCTLMYLNSFTKTTSSNLKDSPNNIIF